jgi:serine/threonine protein kinase
MPDRQNYDSPEGHRVDFSPGQSDPFHRRISDASSHVLQGRWEIVKQLGQGGMGTVYLCQDLRLSKRLCVAKKLRVDFFREEDRQQALAFFEREAMVLSTLKHPNIVLIHDYFEEEGNYFLVMEYVEGENLQHKLMDQGHGFPERDVRNWASKVCEVLNYLHTHRPPVIYRDLKPSNIMVDTAGNIKLVDFGIARPYAEESDNTHVVSGGYSPPEQYWGGADPRSDLYGLGATMHFLLTGEEPLALQTSSPRSVNNKVSAQMDRIVQRATAQDVWLRFQGATEMLAELSAEQKAPPRKSLLPALASLCVVLLLAAAVIGGLSFLDKKDHVATTTHPTKPARHTLTHRLLDAKEPDQEVAKTNPVPAKKGESPKPIASNPILSPNLLPSLHSHGTDLPLLKEPSAMTAEGSREQNRNPYPVEFAFSDSREEMLTDPEGLEGSESAGARPGSQAPQKDQH